MPLRRISSKELQTGAGNSRTQQPGSILRPHVAASAVGNDEVARGVVAEGHHQARATKERHVEPPLVPHETFGWEQLPSRSEVVAERSNPHTVRRGGQPMLVVALTSAFTTAGEIVLRRNGAIFATKALITGSTLFTLGPFNAITLVQFDLVDHEITNAGVGGVGINVAWWLR